MDETVSSDSLGRRKWSPEEDSALRSCYRSRGCKWQGWLDLLPGRSYSAIRNRAKRLGLSSDARFSWSKSLLSNEVMALMRRGMAPSDIDRKLDIPPGTAYECVLSVWAGDNQ